MSNRKLNEKQIAAIEYLSLPNKGGLTDAEIAEKVGISERQLYRWKNDEVFYRELTRKIVRNTTERLPEIMASIPDHIINDGNAALFRTLLQAHGLLTEKVEVESKGNDSSDLDAMKAEIERFRRGTSTDKA